MTTPQAIIDNQIQVISHCFDLLEAANLQAGALPWYTHIPSSRGIPARLRNNELLPVYYQTLKFPDKILNMLSLDQMSALGTWGRYNILVEHTFPDIVPSDDSHIFILHCNIHTEKPRQDSIKDIVHKMENRLAAVGVKDVIVISTNQEDMPEDLVYVRQIHRSFTHWFPYATAYRMKQYFAQYPRSYVITSSYIGALLLDNKLFFNMHFRFHPDVPASLVCALEDVCTHIKNTALQRQA